MLLGKRLIESDYFILIVMFILSRLLFLFFTPFTYYEEEARIGSIGHDIIFGNGLRLPFWGYLDSPHGGGSIFSGLVAIPFYVIFGDRYLALKTAALLFSLLTLLLWYRLLSAETKGSRRILVLCLVFFAFATPHYVQKSLILTGNTVELMFFNVAIISCFWAIRSATAKNSSYLLLGMLCGFSFWVQFMTSYLVCTIFLTLFMTLGIRTAIIRTAFLVIGFVCGSLPLWIYNFQYDWATLTSDARLPVHILAHGDKLKEFFFVELPASFHFLDIGPFKAHYFGFILYGIFIAAVLTHVGRNVYNIRHARERNNGNKINISLELFLILYFFVFVVSTSFTTSPVDGNPGSHGWNSMNVHNEYYIISLQPIIFALLVLLDKYKNKISLALNVSACFVFIVGYSSVFRTSQYNSFLFNPMYATEANAHESGFNYVINPELFLRFQRSVPADLQSSYIRGARELWGYMSAEMKQGFIERAEKLGQDYMEQYSKL